MGRGSWVKGLLFLMKLPRTEANQRFLWGWWQAEGGNHGPKGNIYPSAKFNWLNTTRKALGSTNFNVLNEVTGSGVQNYISWLQGVRQTMRTLRNGRYPDILLALRSGNPFLHQPLNGLSIWVTGKPALDNPFGLTYALRVLEIGKKWNL